MSTKTITYFISIIKNSKELTKKEKEILVQRLREKKLEKIGRKYKVTAQRILQIEERALQKFVQKICQLMLLDS